MKKIVLLLISLLLLCSCGTKKEETVDVVDSSKEEVTEVVSNRSIIVADINGTATVTHSSGEKLEAYEGMNLLDGDDVIVNESSNLTLNIDSDKHLFADANTHFWLSATGSENNTKTLIHLEAGSVLCDIKEKLTDNETFDIETATSTMCVRGTVFRVCLLEGNDKSTFDLVEVYDGKVWSSIDDTEDNVTLEPGQCALIRKTESSDVKAAYVLEEDIDDKFVKETGLNISLEKAENGEQGALKISLDNVPVETLSRLETIIEEGTDLAVEKEEITQVKEEKIEEIKKAETKEEPKPVVQQVPQKVEEPVHEEPVHEEPVHEEPQHHTHTEKMVVITPATCIATGLCNYVCAECGETLRSNVEIPINPDGHVSVKSTKSIIKSCKDIWYDNKYVCSICGKELSAKANDPIAHVDGDGNGTCDYCLNSIYELNNLTGLYANGKTTTLTLNDIRDELITNGSVNGEALDTFFYADAEFSGIGNNTHEKEVHTKVSIHIDSYTYGSAENEKEITSESTHGLDYDGKLISSSHSGYGGIPAIVRGLDGLNGVLDEIYQQYHDFK